MEAYAALGIEQVWVNAQGPRPAEWVESFSRAAVRRLAEL
jgi:hypothetical protein